MNRRGAAAPGHEYMLCIIILADIEKTTKWTNYANPLADMPIHKELCSTSNDIVEQGECSFYIVYSMDRKWTPQKWIVAVAYPYIHELPRLRDARDCGIDEDAPKYMWRDLDLFYYLTVGDYTLSLNAHLLTTIRLNLPNSSMEAREVQW